MRFLVLLSFLGLGFSAQAAERIVTLAPVLAEWSAEILGVKEAKTQIVGVSEYSDYPVELKTIERIGPYPQINIEKIASLKPTLVIASSEYNRGDQLEKLKRLKLRVEILPIEKFSSMEEWIRKLGGVLNAPKEASLAAARWKKSVQELKKGTPKRVLIQVQDSPIVVVGGDSFLNEAFAAIGMQNVFSDLKQSYPKVSREAVLKENPDVIYIIDLTGKPEDFERSKAVWQKFASLKAVKNNQMKIIPGDDFARCSPRLLNALKQLQ